MHLPASLLPDSGGLGAAVALWMGLIGSLSFVWALWLQARLSSITRRAKLEMATADLSKGFKKALLTGAAQGAVVLKAQGREQQYYGEGKALYPPVPSRHLPHRRLRRLSSSETW